jgi:hypothetical protein
MYKNEASIINHGIRSNGIHTSSNNTNFNNINRHAGTNNSNSHKRFSSTNSATQRNVHSVSNDRPTPATNEYETDQDNDEQYDQDEANDDDELLNYDLDEEDEEDDVFGEANDGNKLNGNFYVPNVGCGGESQLKNHYNSMSTASCILNEVNYLEKSHQQQQQQSHHRRSGANITPDTSITNSNSSSSNSSVSSPAATNSDQPQTKSIRHHQSQTSAQHQYLNNSNNHQPQHQHMQPPPFLPDSAKFFPPHSTNLMGKNTRIIHHSIPNTPVNKYHTVTSRTGSTMTIAAVSAKAGMVTATPGRYNTDHHKAMSSSQNYLPAVAQQHQQQPYQQLTSRNLNNAAFVMMDVGDRSGTTRNYKFQPSSSSSASSPTLPPSPLPQLPYTTRSSLIAPVVVQSDFSSSKSNAHMKLSPSLANFSHFDVQSTFFNGEYVRLIMSTLHTSVNIKTGASGAAFASLQSGGGSNDAISENKNKKHSSVNHQLQQGARLSAASTTCGSMASSTSTTLLDQPRPAAALASFYINKENESPGSSSSDEITNDGGLELVEACASFRIEVGGDTFRGLGLVHDVSQRRMMKLNSSAILDKCSTHYFKKELCELIETNSNEPFTIEYQDWGAYFYRYYFVGQDHANYVGTDAELGPLVISIRREKLLAEQISRSNSSNASAGQNGLSAGNSGNNSERNYDYVYRFILRTSDVSIFYKY